VKAIALSFVLISTAAFAQQASMPIAPGTTAPNVPPPAAAAPDPNASPPQFSAQGGSVLTLRGLEKITGRPTNITAPIGKPVSFASLTITARYCYSTPPSEPPETAAFVQISDHRPNQPEKQVFSGWMYASTPGLNGMEHPLYDVWAISCNNIANAAAPQASTSAPSKVAAPDSSDKDKPTELPVEAGR
jgi:hypothetical protein